MQSRFETIVALILTDRESPLDSNDFDTELWFLLLDRISSLEDAEAYPKPVIHYFASRFLQWEVGNGGFAQAAYNIPEWFAAAAEGYDALGLPRSARMIRDAMRWLPAERSEIERKGLFRATIGQVFAHFAKSRIAIFDGRIVDSEWYVDDLRVKYARANADAFCAVG